METSSRMRRILRRNYQGSDHHGAAADYEDSMEQKQEKHKAASPSNASIVAAEAISSDVGREEDENDDVSSNGEPSSDIQRISSGRGEHSLKSGESLDPPVSGGLDSEPIPTLVAPGYVPFEHNERIVLELPSSMVRPLKVLKGTFQVSLAYINQLSLSISYVLAHFPDVKMQSYL